MEDRLCSGQADHKTTVRAALEMLRKYEHCWGLGGNNLSLLPWNAGRHPTLIMITLDSGFQVEAIWYEYDENGEDGEVMMKMVKTVYSLYLIATFPPWAPLSLGGAWDGWQR